MYTIGSFAKMSAMTAKTLRFYDEIGLVKPAEVDPVNRYRYYTYDQLDQVRWIHELKGYGLSLENISRLLLNGEQKEVMNQVRLRLEELKREQKQLLLTISNMERRLKLMNVESNEMQKQFEQHPKTRELSNKLKMISNHLYQEGEHVTREDVLKDASFQELLVDLELPLYAIVQLERRSEKTQTEYLLALALSEKLDNKLMKEATGQEWYQKFCQREMPIVWLYRGIACRVLGLFDDSEILLRKSLTIELENVELLKQLGETLILNRKYTEAEQIFKSAIEINPKEWCLLYLLGVTYNLSGDYINASNKLSEVLSMEPFHLALYERGLANFRMAQYQEAVEDYNNAIELCQINYLYYYNKGIALWYLGRYSEAVEEYNKALDLEPHYGLSHYNRGVAMMCLTRWEEAIPCFIESIRLESEVAFSYFEWAKASLRLHDRQTANSMLTEAIKRDPNLEVKAISDWILKDL